MSNKTQFIANTKTKDLKKDKQGSDNWYKRTVKKNEHHEHKKE